MGTGFYLIGFFEKRYKAGWIVDRAKPFEIDSTLGFVSGRVIRLFKRNRVANVWYYVYNKNITDIDKDLGLRKELNEVWKGWCEKYKRKYSPILQTNRNKLAGGKLI